MHLTCRSYNCQVHLTFRTASNAINCGGKVCKECVDIWLCRHGRQLSRRMAQSQRQWAWSLESLKHVYCTLSPSLSLSHTHTHTLSLIHHTHTHSLSYTHTHTYFRNEVFVFNSVQNCSGHKQNKKHWVKNENVQMS